jgi:hypothetical protein
VPYPRIFHLPFCIGDWALKRAQYTVFKNQTEVLPGGGQAYSSTTTVVTESSSLTSAYNQPPGVYN